ncbi:hypothetical protein CLM62_37675 [Streptomyces sp. SA15]|uniref:SCO7613 C-terminal domain-containing membrane protein n=1 Tax=Streptomyces sp. SA15 TaxID=934019 RepID=UPI000BB07F3E|nr:hypothetical protein [Streptomyces sp. SA15]PAZ10999.1 hypothetical protein CLM62_37675 [Streptomyces sp. SA15]
MTQIPPPAEELRLLDAELWQLDARRAQLLARRAWLVAALHRVQPQAPVAPPRPEAAAPSVQNVLLLLGGVLLTIAAMVFTLVSWGHLGITGRALVFGAVTLAALAVPAVLLKRGLRSTAESVAGLGLALTVLDAYALHEVALAGTDGAGYAAVASAVLAGTWLAYGLLPGTAGLRLPLPAALAAAQLPLLLWALAAGADPYGITAALLVTAGVDTLVALRGTAGSVRVVAAVGAYGMGAWGVLTAGWLSWTATGPSAAARAAALLTLGSAIALGAAWHGGRTAVREAGEADGRADQRAPGGADGRGDAREPGDADSRIEQRGPGDTKNRPDQSRPGGLRGRVDAREPGDTDRRNEQRGPADTENRPDHSRADEHSPGATMGHGDARTPGERRSLGLAVTSGLLMVAALGGLARSVLPEMWTVPAHLACGIALLAAVLAGRLPDAVRQGLGWASGAVQALAVLWALPVVGVAVLGPVGWAERAWTGTPSDVRAAVTIDAPWPPEAAAAPIVPAAVAVVLALVVRDAAWRPRARTGALGLIWATALVLPAVLELPYFAGLLAQGVTAAGALAAAAYMREATPDAEGRRLTALVLALVTSLSLALLSLASQTATLVVLGALTALFASASWRAHLAPVTAPAALAYAAALAAATGAAADWQPEYTALLVLAVPVASALLAARLGDSRSTVPVEVAGAAAALLAVGLAAGDPPILALVLALCAVIAAGTAIRPGRRSVAYASGALFVLATWVRLAAWDVDTPEAYTIPVTVPALLVGALRRRRDPQASSWTAYGSGLAATLVPSLVAAWGDPHWTRPLLLGAAALLVTLLGARHHLQAPLLLGGSVLALVALHELAPYLVQVTGALPRWVPPALAGLLLLALGATYEQRIRDVRRVREVLERMD